MGQNPAREGLRPPVAASGSQRQPWSAPGRWLQVRRREYGDCDSGYVFVNLFAEPYGAPLHYQAVHKLVCRLHRRSGVDFTLHMLRHYVDGRVMWPEAGSPLVAEPRGLVPAT